ncbi:hypothetical protein ABIA39_008351 [Nocardia sp. GAS34]|uniref:hypothetical protein n=1 Tax=unclassified Nocardia TaxID=2637762 RepID=UPI003D1D37A9
MIGSGRTPAALATAAALATRWWDAGGQVADAVTWPEAAASWLRQATRFAAAAADLWVMTGPATGRGQMTRRLLWSTSWTPRLTLGTASIGTPQALQLVGGHHLDELVGAHADGMAWVVAEGVVRPLTV